jgi:ubiquitin carboxyl-terminal hydrolase 7
MDLKAVLAARKKYVEECSETVEGIGVSSGELRASADVLAGMKFTPRSDTGFVGLDNQGATCYLNSLLQALYMIPEFRRVLFAWKYVPTLHGEEQYCATRQLQRLFAQLQLSVRGSVSTAALTRSFGWSGADSFVQHDVQECMTVLFDFLASQCLDSDLGHFIARGIMGEASNELKCCNCGNIRRRPENYRDLQLQVRGETSVLGSIKTYLKEEFIDGVECHSSTCSGSRYQHSSRVAIERLPDVLFVQLRRFDINYETMQR